MGNSASMGMGAFSNRPLHLFYLFSFDNILIIFQITETLRVRFKFALIVKN